MALDTRTQTLQALDSFIEVQRSLVARQKDDMERLQTLQKDVSENFSAVLENLSDELGHTAFHLSAQTDLRLALPSGISWSVFDKADTTQLHNLAAQIRQKYASRTTPSACQQSCLSELQLLVKRAKKEIIDPVLEWVAKSTANLVSDSDDEEEDAAAAADDQDIDPLERKRREEKMKILELKKRKIKGSAGGHRASGSSLTTRNVVFVRDDVEDETHDVDVCAWGDDLNARRQEGQKPDPLRAQPSSSHFETNGGDSHVGPQTSKNDSDGNERPRRRRAKIVLPSKQRIRNAAKRKSSVAPTGASATTDATTTTDEGLCSSPRTAQPRPDTYKQAWSMDEQHLLERLLEEIPEGEKNRWLKISQAMGGKRTPRQVASRVQKYFEKLKKFGVAVG